jgi:cytochrome c556
MAAVGITTTQLSSVVKTTDEAAIAAAFRAVDNDCYAPHKQFRKAL